MSTEINTDNDGIGNSLDSDDDGDGCLDVVDNCILVVNSSLIAMVMAMGSTGNQEA